MRDTRRPANLLLLAERHGLLSDRRVALAFDARDDRVVLTGVLVVVGFAVSIMLDAL